MSGLTHEGAGGVTRSRAPGLIAMPIVVDAANNDWGGGPPAMPADVAVTGNVTFNAGAHLTRIRRVDGMCS